MKPNRTFLIGISIYLGMFVFCVLFSILLPLRPYEQKIALKDLSPAQDYLSIPEEITPDQVEKIVSGVSFGCVLLKNKEVVTWGEDAFLPETIENVKDIAAGDHHVIVLYEDHTLKLFSTETLQLPDVEQNKTMERVFASGNASALMTTNHEVYYSDANIISKTWNENQGHIIDVAMNDHQIAVILDDHSVQIYGEIENEIAAVPEFVCPISDLVLSEHDALALCDNQQVMSWGESAYAVAEHKHKAKMIDASKETLIILDEAGHVNAFGGNTFHESEVSDERFDRIYTDAYQMYGLNEEIHAWGNQGFLMGSDAYGRDLFARMVHGGLITMSIGWIAVITELILAIFIGCFAGYYGGKLDQILMRLTEIISSIPFLPLIITLSAFLKEWMPEHGRIVFVMILYGVISAPMMARMIRSILLSEREKEYVIATQLLGANTWHILRKELLPSILPLLLVNLTISYADSMLLESALSFIGFGVTQPYPSWGNLLENAQSAYVLEHCWWQWVLPALCIVICVFAIHLVQEGLRKMTDPKEVRK